MILKKTLLVHDDLPLRVGALIGRATASTSTGSSASASRRSGPDQTTC